MSQEIGGYVVFMEPQAGRTSLCWKSTQTFVWVGSALEFTMQSRTSSRGTLGLVLQASGKVKETGFHPG